MIVVDSRCHALPHWFVPEMTMLDQAQQDRSNLLKDPKLPHLATVMDVSAMAGHFTQYLHALGVEPAWEVTRCAIEGVYYRRAKHCSVLYRLTLRHPSGVEADEWFHGRMFPPGHGDKQFAEEAPAVTPSHPAYDFFHGIQAVSLWRDFDMILWMFPHDPGVVTLPDMVDPVFIRRQVEINLQLLNVLGNEGHSGLDAWRCTDIRCDRVKYVPGSRCVLRYHANLLGPSGASRDVTFYSKTYSDTSSRDHFKFLQTVCEQLVAQAAAVNIPQPLLHLDGANTFWQDDWKGNALIDVLADFDWQELFPRISGMMAAFHRSRINGLRSGPSLNDVLIKATEGEARLAYLLPQHQHWMSRVLKRLTDAKSVLEQQQIPTVPIHGTCRVEQMLARDAELALVDFDAVALGDPLYDIAEFIASLQYLEFSQGRHHKDLAKATDVFYASYAEQVKWPCDRQRVAWYVLAFFMSKMYSSIKHLDVLAVQRLDASGQDMMDDWLGCIG